MGKIGPKNWFFGSFWEVFCLSPLTPQFLYQMKGLMKIYNCGKFHLFSICGLQVINFQMLCGDAASMKWSILGWFWALSPANMRGFYWHFDQRYCFIRKRQCINNLLKLCLKGKRDVPKLTVLVHFWVQFTPGKSKIMPKNNIFPETTSLALLNYTSPRSHINQRILIKLI